MKLIKNIIILLLTNFICNYTSFAESKLEVVSPSKNQIIKLDDNGIHPEVLNLNKSGDSVFFLNNSKNSKVSLEIDYGVRRGFCASGKMLMSEDGKFKSIEPFAPKAFTTVCFSEPGEYKVKVIGLKSHPEGLFSKVVVSDSSDLKGDPNANS